MDDTQQRTRLLAAEETLPDYLKRRERELVQQTAALRGMLAPKEKELAEVRQAMQVVGVQRSYTDELNTFLDPDEKNPYGGGTPNQNPYQLLSEMAGQAGTPLPLLVESMTIKEMILRALSDHFHDGATPTELREYMRAAYSRDVDRNSISPQLARLRDEGHVQNANVLNESGKWQLTRGVSADDLIGIGHWPPGAKHPKKD
jgi:hypothetical protein